MLHNQGATHLSWQDRTIKGPRFYEGEPQHGYRGLWPVPGLPGVASNDK